MDVFDHERLDVYKAAIELLVIADGIANALPRGRRYLADQLRRASTSVAFNIAEGAGEFAAADKARFYRIARRSATESSAVLDACRRLELSEASITVTARGYLLRIVAMLTAMVLRLTESGSGSRAGTGSV